MSLKTLFRKVLPRSIWTKLRLMRLRKSIRQFKPTNVQHCYGSISLQIHLADALAKGWYDRDWETTCEIDLLRQGSLKAGARVFDLGAHQCVIALLLGKIVGPTGSVLAVDGNWHNCEVGKKNCELNGVSWISVRHAAVAEKSGTVLFNEALNGQVDDGTGGWGIVKVPSYSIDDLAVQYGEPEVLFIDVEGFEATVLKGATQTLKRRPDAFVEVHVGCGLEKFGGTVESVLSFFPANEYQRFISSEDHQEPVILESAKERMKKRFFLTAIRSTGTV
jgi:FkbM family methyltransferase